MSTRQMTIRPCVGCDPIETTVTVTTQTYSIDSVPPEFDLLNSPVNPPLPDVASSVAVQRTRSAPRPTVAPRQPMVLAEPVECPYRGERKLRSDGEPEQAKCGCKQNLMFPVYWCTHPDNTFEKRDGTIEQKRCLPTVGYQPKESHVPRRFFTPCLFCKLNPNHKENEDVPQS